jgi:hypothetical protein
MIIFDIFKGIIGSVELIHVFLHFLVLFGLKKKVPIKVENKILYFSIDLITSLIAFSISGKNGTNVAIHAIVHICALLNLLGFFKDDYLWVILYK